MTGDPYNHRCRRCGLPLLDPGTCGRENCYTDLEAIRAGIAWVAGVALAGARKLGLVR